MKFDIFAKELLNMKKVLQGVYALIALVVAEESSIMSGATVVRDANLYPWEWCPNPDSFVKGSFKHFTHSSETPTLVHEFKVDLG